MGSALRTDVEIGYGVRNNAGLFTLYGELAAVGPDRTYRAGVRMRLGSGWLVNLQGEGREGLFARGAAPRLTVEWGGGAEAAY